VMQQLVMAVVVASFYQFFPIALCILSSGGGVVAEIFSNEKGLLIPLYVWPTYDGTSCVDAHYRKVAESSKAGTYTIAIVNPDNGPNYDDDLWKKASYDACIAYLIENNVEVIGYIHTKRNFPNIDGYRSIEAITADIDFWKDNYPDVSGIFIDEVTNRWPDATFDSRESANDVYKEIIDYVIDAKDYGRAVINPGGPYFEELVVSSYSGNPKVISVVFESPANRFLPPNDADCLSILNTETQGSFAPGPWCQYIPNWDGIEPLQSAMESDGSIATAQSAVMVYNNNGDDDHNNVLKTQEMIQHGIDANIGWFYITDKSVWSDTPSQEIMDAQSEMLRQQQQTCQDSSLRFDFKPGRKKKNCKQIAKKKEKRCRKESSKENCPVTCKEEEPSCTCFETQGEFIYDSRKGNTKNCEWVAMKSEARCRHNSARSHCPKICGVC